MKINHHGFVSENSPLCPTSKITEEYCTGRGDFRATLTPASVIVLTVHLSLISQWTSIIRDAFVTAFYITTGIVAVLTLRRASQTLLQPRWTETYKEQIKVFHKINDFFNSAKEESANLLSGVGFLSVLHATLWVIFDRYAREQLHYEDFRKGQARLYDGLQKGRVIPGVSFEQQTNPGSRQTWYYVTDSFSQAQRTLRDLRDHPFLPPKGVNLIHEFLKTLNENLFVIYDVSESIMQELAQRYPTPSAYDKAEISWAAIKVHVKLKSLKEPADRIQAFIREYTEADSIFKRPRKKSSPPQ